MGCEVLLGTWRSVRDLSINYNLEHHSPTKAQIEYYSNVLGRLTLTYAKIEITEHFSPKVESKVNDKPMSFGLDEYSYSYELVSCTCESKSLLHCIQVIQKHVESTLNDSKYVHIQFVHLRTPREAEKYIFCH